MKNLFLFFVLSLLLLPVSMIGQVVQESVVDGVFSKEHIANRKPIPYVHVREADVMWQKVVYRIIDLREKINLPLYYPNTSVDGRSSLISVLLEGLNMGELTTYSANFEDEFKVRVSREQILQDLGAVNDTQYVMNAETRKEEQKVIVGEVRTDQVKQILIKEVWFFDRNYSRMDVRIIGMCPIREYIKDDKVTKRLLFWVYFPEVRPLLARKDVFNPKNDAARYSFDDIFIKRYFGSYIYRESNVYNNRQINNYAVGVEAMMEAERIKNDLYTKEHDMWEF